MNPPHLLIQYFPFVGKSSFCFFPLVDILDSLVLFCLRPVPYHRLWKMESVASASQFLSQSTQTCPCRHGDTKVYALSGLLKLSAAKAGYGFAKEPVAVVLKWCPVLLCLQVLFRSFLRPKASWEFLRSARMSVCGRVSPGFCFHMWCGHLKPIGLVLQLNPCEAPRDDAPSSVPCSLGLCPNVLWLWILGFIF